MSAYFTDADCDIGAFTQLIDRQLDPAAVPHAARVVSNLPVYDVAGLAGTLADVAGRRRLMGEWATVLRDHSGALVLKGALTDMAVLDEATALFNRIIAQERETSTGGDHFAGAGANDRVWNSLQKMCLAAPGLFARYFASPAIAAACEAWLGPGYQMTAQVNLVHPGGKAQVAHRDYHLGFMEPERAAAFPAQAHLLSPFLTLQGAIAHCDMPVESGPTRLLPFSQAFGPGYLACLRPEFRALFAARHVQVALDKGDALFFSPALFHAAGDNRSAAVQRMANLVQISSPMGRSLEAVDRVAMVRALFPVLKSMALPPAQQAAVIAAAAEGYPFPTNLDTDPPVGGLMGESQAELLARALAEGMSEPAFAAALAAHGAKRVP